MLPGEATFAATAGDDGAVILTAGAAVGEVAATDGAVPADAVTGIPTAMGGFAVTVAAGAFSEAGAVAAVTGPVTVFAAPVFAIAGLVETSAIGGVAGPVA